MLSDINAGGRFVGLGERVGFAADRHLFVDIVGGFRALEFQNGFFQFGRPVGLVQITVRRNHRRAVDLKIIAQIRHARRVLVIGLDRVVQFVHHGDGCGFRAVLFGEPVDVDGDRVVIQNRTGCDAFDEFEVFRRAARDVADRDELVGIGRDAGRLERDRRGIARIDQNVRPRRCRIDFQRRTGRDVTGVVGFVVVDALFQQADQLDRVDLARRVVDQVGDVDRDDAVGRFGFDIAEHIDVLADRDGFVQIVRQIVAGKVDAGGVFNVPVDFRQLEFARRNARHGVGVRRGLQAGRCRNLEFYGRTAGGLLDFDRRAVRADGETSRAGQGRLNHVVEFFNGVRDGHDAGTQIDRNDDFVRFGRIAG